MKFTDRKRNLYNESGFHNISMKNCRVMILPMEAARSKILCNGYYTSYTYLHISRANMITLAYNHALENCRLNKRLELRSQREKSISQGEHHYVWL